MKTFTKSWQVSADDIDWNGHINNIAYLRQANRIAGEHWRAATPDEMFNTCLWVVRRHEIDYLAEAFEGQQLQVITWIDKTEKAISYRRVQIKNGEQLIANVLTHWYLLDATTKKPQRISEEINKLFID